MHLSIEELRELSAAYRSEELLDDRHLAMKRHLAACDACYEKFCAEYMLQKVLTEERLLNDEALHLSMQEEETGDLAAAKTSRTVLHISGIRGKVRELMVQAAEAVLEIPKWNFNRTNVLATARGAQSADIYRVSCSDETMISLDGSVLKVVLDEEVYDGEKYILQITDEEHREQLELVYDEDTGLYTAQADLAPYRENVQIDLIEKA